MNMVGAVNATAGKWWVVFMTPRINIGTADHMDTTCLRLLFSLKDP
jgi:hypothetical protein